MNRRILAICLAGLLVCIWIVASRPSKAGGWSTNHIKGTESADPYRIALSMSPDGKSLVYASRVADSTRLVGERRFLSSLDVLTGEITHHRFAQDRAGQPLDYFDSFISCCLEQVPSQNGWIARNLFFDIYGYWFVLDPNSELIHRAEMDSEVTWNCSDCPSESELRSTLEDVIHRFDLNPHIANWPFDREWDFGSQVTMARNVGDQRTVYIALSGLVREFSEAKSRVVFDRNDWKWENRVRLVRVSPNGRYLVVCRPLTLNIPIPNPQTSEELYIVDLKLDKVGRVGTYDQIGGVVWAPDNRSFYLVGRGKKQGIFKVANKNQNELSE